MSKDAEVIYVVEDWFDYNCGDFTDKNARKLPILIG